MKKTLVFAFLLAVILCAVGFAVGSALFVDNRADSESDTTESAAMYTPFYEESSQEPRIYEDYNFIMTSGGNAHTVALQDDGTVWGWGNDFYGCINSKYPCQIQGLADIVYVSAGCYASAAIKSDGSLWMWGAGWKGNGPFENYNLSLDHPIMHDVKDVAIGNRFTVALKSDGTVWIWGADNSHDMEAQLVPQKLDGLPEIVQVTASWDNAAFLDTDGNVWILDNQYSLPRVPEKAQGLTDIKSISGGGHHFVALGYDGSVYTWTGTTSDKKVLKQVEELSDVVAVAAGAFHSVAVKNDGTVWCWGENEHGLGDGVNTKSKTPVQVLYIEDAIGASCGDLHTTVVTSDGSLWAWGADYMGQLGRDAFFPIAGVTSAVTQEWANEIARPAKILFFKT